MKLSLRSQDSVSIGIYLLKMLTLKTGPLQMLDVIIIVIEKRLP